MIPPWRRGTLALMRLGSLSPNPQNPRKISPEQSAGLKASLDEFGPLDGIVYNVQLKQLVGFHQRQAVLPPDVEVVIEKRYANPSKKGTTAVGYAQIDGERFSYREVSWAEDRHLAATVAANKQGGEWDRGKLTEIFLRLDTLNFELGTTGFTDKEIANLCAPVGLPPSPADETADKKQVTFEASTGPKNECPRCAYKF